MASNPSYEQSKQIAEASRESEWAKPSFGKELFLGNFRLDLIHPQPELDPAAVEKGQAFLERFRVFLTERVDRQRIEREAKIPDDVIQGLKDLGALGMKIPEEYGGLGLSQVYYNKALATASGWHPSISVLLSAHQSIGLPEPLRLFGT
jgi:alkylation response protein AidB-like acyl-CoA dehydrogenase